MRSGGKGVRIVPRVLFEGWSLNHFQELFASESKRTELAEFLGDNLSVRTVETFCVQFFFGNEKIRSITDAVVIPRNISLMAQSWNFGASLADATRGECAFVCRRSVTHVSNQPNHCHFSLPIISDAIKVIKDIGKQLHSRGMDIILVIPPQRGEESVHCKIPMSCFPLVQVGISCLCRT